MYIYIYIYVYIWVASRGRPEDLNGPRSLSAVRHGTPPWMACVGRCSGVGSRTGPDTQVPTPLGTPTTITNNHNKEINNNNKTTIVMMMLLTIIQRRTSRALPRAMSGTRRARAC